MTDFDCAKHTTGVTSKKDLSGTDGYRAPEVNDGKTDVGPFSWFKADVYSLGMTLLELCGFPPKYIIELKGPEF